MQFYCLTQIVNLANIIARRNYQGGPMKKRNELVLDFCATQNLPLLIFMGGGYSDPIDHTVKAFHNLFVQCTKTIGTIKS